MQDTRADGLPKRPKPSRLEGFLALPFPGACCFLLDLQSICSRDSWQAQCSGLLQQQASGMASEHAHPPTCQCALHKPPAVQSLDELDFLKSACSAAQTGNLARLERLITAHPEAVHADGAGGTSVKARE